MPPTVYPTSVFRSSRKQVTWVGLCSGIVAFPGTVNLEILARILFSRIAFKDIFATLKICD